MGDMGQGYQQPKKYHVCGSCPRWCYTDRLKQQGGLCLCGAFIDRKQHTQGSWAGWNIQGQQQ
eukprot:9574603-Heterocapsa_arctica.AAC.1